MTKTLITSNMKHALLAEAALPATTKYLQMRMNLFSSWQCKCLISTGFDAGAQAPPLLLLCCSWAWRGAGREPGVMPESSAGAPSRDACLPETRWRTCRTLVCPMLAVPTALCSHETRNPNPLGLIFAQVNPAAAHNPRACPQPSASLPRKWQAVAAAGGLPWPQERCPFPRWGLHRAVVFRGCWLHFSACNPREQINCSEVGSVCTEADGATLV